MQRVLIVGAGFSGAVCARQLALAGIPSLVVERRDHIGGNCHTERDASTGVMVHRYGPHIFNTNHRHVWDYIRRFGEFGAYVNRVKATTARGVFSLPINLLTLNQFFGKRFSPDEARAFVDTLGDRSISEPRNFEEQALRFLGRELYETFFYGYTKKQWGVEPRELPASILKRLPLRFTYDDNYHNARYIGIPLEGYTPVIGRILDHDLIEVKTGVGFEPAMREAFRHTVYTGPLDALFDHVEGRLGYRTVTWQRHERAGDFQGVAAMNYTEERVPYTRITEHKHFAPWEDHAWTVAFTEYSHETGPGDDPYYPKRLAEDKRMLAAYRARAGREEGLSCLGRLGTYRYLDMDDTLHEALAFGDTLAKSLTEGTRPPVFP